MRYQREVAHCPTYTLPAVFSHPTYLTSHFRFFRFPPPTTSLTYFSKMFSHCIDRAEKADDVPTRLLLLSEFVTRFIFNNVSRGLFEEHKNLYSFLVSSGSGI